MSEPVQEMFHFMSEAQAMPGRPRARCVADVQAACAAAPGGLGA